MRLHKRSSMILVVAAVLTTSFAQGQTHAPWPTDWNNWSDPAFWVTVGNPGNAGELSGGAGAYGPRICGAVDHNYQIGKYEVTTGQYKEFLDAKAAVTDIYGLYNANMWSSSYGCKIQQSGSGTEQDPYTYSVASDYANRPVNFVSFWDAARFTNWLHNGQGIGGDTETGVYTLGGYNGVDGRTIARNLGTKFFIPSEDEWYKAAYHKNDGVTDNYWDYPTGVDTPVPGRDLTELTNAGNNANHVAGSPYPIDSPHYTTLAGEFQLSDSPYGTFDQGGNVWEWNEAIVHTDGDYAFRGLRGGSFNNGTVSVASSLTNSRSGYFPTYEGYDVGFRVASVPEPGSITLVIVGGLCLLAYAWRRRGAI